MAIDRTEPPDADQPMSLSFRAGRVAAVLAVLAMVLFWAWIFAGGPKKANPDRLQDRAFVSRTAARCDDLIADLRKLPNAAGIDDALRRAGVLDRADARVDRMLKAIEADAPREGTDAKVTRAWLTDWRTYLQDRRDYAGRLRVDPGAQLFLSRSPLQDSVDKTIEVFADVNDMPQCATPGDVG